MTAKSSLQADLERLAAIVEALESRDLDLDRALELFEEGVTRMRAAQGHLAAAELRLRQLRETAGGGGGSELADLGR